MLLFAAVAAALVYAFPLTRFILSALVTLFHEFGHAVAGWLLGYPSLPAFDFVYGGGFTHLGVFHRSIAVAVFALLCGLVWLFRENRRAMGLLIGVIAVWLVLVSAEWRRELVVSAAGHLSEFILAGVLFYKALTGSGLRNPEVERPVAAFIALFVQLHSFLFALRLTRDAELLARYREGKGGALMNDLEAVALDLQIHFGIEPGIIGVARWLLLFSFVPMVVAVVLFVKRRRFHEVMRGLRTAA